MEGMKEYEKTHMLDNLDRLIGLTSCNVTLRSILRGNNILGDEDVQELSLDTLTDRRKCEILYNKLIQKNNKNTYPVLISALKENCDSGAVFILEYELEEKLAQNPAKKARIQKYISLPVGLEEFLKSQTASSSSSSWTSWLKPKSSRVKKALIICTAHIDITLEKIEDLNLEGLDEVLVDENDALKRLKNDSKKSPQVLAVKTSNIANFFQKIGSISRKIVLLTEESTAGVQKSLLNIPGLDWSKCTQIEEDKIRWSDLTPQFAHEVLERTAFLQNTPFQLKTLLKLLGDDGDNNLETRLNGEFLASLISDKCPPFFKNTVPPSFQYYIPRRILSRARISKEIFKKQLPDIFLFSGIQIHELTMFVGPSETGRGRRTDTSRNQMLEKALKVRYIVLQLKDHFEGICKKTVAPVHWLQYENGGFTWIKSRGNMANLHELVAMDRKEKYPRLTEEDFVAKLNSKNPVNRSKMPVCISDTPGMGKTVLLASVGRILMNQCDEKLVIFAMFSEFVVQVKNQIGATPNLHKALINVISNYVCEKDNNLGISLFQNGLKKGKFSVELLLDGYDEVNSQDIQLANDCLRCIMEKLNSVRVIVSTRPHLLLSLENILQTLGFHMVPFSKDDQIEFLIKYWRSQHPPDWILIHERLKRFGKNCLEALKTKMSEKEKDIAGTPLLCLLIAQVYQKTAESYSDSDNLVDIGEDVDLAPDEVDITCITDLFRYAVKVKLESYKTRYSIEYMDEDGLIRAHIHESIRLLFPSNHNIPEEGTEEVKQYPVEILLKIGILERSSTELVPRFIHRSFAEYFASVFAVSNFHENANDQIVNFVVSFVLSTTRVELPFFNELDLDGLHLFASTFTFQLAVYFINSQMSTLPPTPSNYQDIGQQMGSSERCDMALACTHDDHPHLFRYLLQSKFFELDEHFLLSRNFLVVTVLKSSVSMLELLEEECAQFRGQLEGAPLFKDPSWMLLAAVKRGIYPIFEYLCYNNQFKEAVQQAHKTRIRFLHATTIGTWDESPSSQHDGIINQRIQIVRLLLKTNRLLIHQMCTIGATVLCSLHVHISLLLELVKPCYGANLLQTLEWDGMTVLHKVASYLTNEQFQEFVLQIPKNILKQLLESKDNDGLTPLHYLLEHSTPLDETLELFSKYGADLKHHSYLERAFLNGRSSDCISSLIKFGAKWGDLGKAKGATPLHVAALYGSRELFQLFLSFRMDQNAIDAEHNTPLFFAVQNTTGSQLEIVNELLKYRADIRATNKLKQNVLHAAAEVGELETVQLLLERGLLVELNAKDAEGNTPLHKAIHWFEGESDYEIISLLVERGADINARNNLDETPIMKMLNSGRIRNHLATIALLTSKGALISKQVAGLALKAVVCEKFGLEQKEFEHLANKCLEKGGELEERDKQGRTLLHHAAQNFCLRGVHFLLSRGLKAKEEDNKETTPLHLVVLKVTEHTTRFQIVKALVDADSSVVNALDGRGETPLSTLVNYSEDPRDFDAQLVELLQCPPQTARKIMESVITGSCDNIKKIDKDLARTLIQCGAELEWKKESVLGASWLHLAAEHGSIDAVMFFVDQGLNPDVRDDLGNTPSHSTMRNRKATHVDRLRFLVQRGANIKAVNNVGESILHWAVRYGRFSAVEYLLSMGCDVNATGGSEGGTALHYCFMGDWCLNQFRVTELLLKNQAYVNTIAKSGNSVADLAIKAFQKAYKNGEPDEDLRFVELLIDHELDLMRRNKEGSPFLHLLPSFLTPTQFHQVVDHVVSKGKTEALRLLDESKENIVQAARKHIEVDGKTLALLKSCGLDIE